MPARVRATGPAALEVEFDDPQIAVAPGQAVVCYDGDAVIAGAWITRAAPVPEAASAAGIAGASRSPGRMARTVYRVPVMVQPFRFLRLPMLTAGVLLIPD